MASAKCISSIVVRTPSLQLGVLQSLCGSFQLVRSHLLTSLVHTSDGVQSEAATSLSSTKAAQVGHKGVNPFTMCTIVNSWPSSKCSGTGGTTCIKPRTQSRSTPTMPTSCTGKTPEITIGEWHAGMQNLWNTTSN